MRSQQPRLHGLWRCQRTSSFLFGSEAASPSSAPIRRRRDSSGGTCYSSNSKCSKIVRKTGGRAGGSLFESWMRRAYTGAAINSESDWGCPSMNSDRKGLPAHERAVFDACLLADLPVADVLLRAAKWCRSSFTPVWSDSILEETYRTQTQKFAHPWPSERAKGFRMTLQRLS